MAEFRHTAGWFKRSCATKCLTLFQHIAARRRLDLHVRHERQRRRFNTQPPEGGWAKPKTSAAPSRCFNTQPPKGGWLAVKLELGCSNVSTHSRPKAAGTLRLWNLMAGSRFNTQPPEGGWSIQAERIRLQYHVSTHSRPKAAGLGFRNVWVIFQVSTHSRPKAAGVILFAHRLNISCFNTQPPEGGWERLGIVAKDALQFQHTAARRRLGLACSNGFTYAKFQHTAARRRLALTTLGDCKSDSCFNTQPPEGGWRVNIPAMSEMFRTQFQHTAARRRLGILSHQCYLKSCFNTQPPEGGWGFAALNHSIISCFNTQPPEGGWVGAHGLIAIAACFNTQPPEGGWG